MVARPAARPADLQGDRAPAARSKSRGWLARWTRALDKAGYYFPAERTEVTRAQHPHHADQARLVEPRDTGDARNAPLDLQGQQALAKKYSKLIPFAICRVSPAARSMLMLAIVLASMVAAANPAPPVEAASMKKEPTRYCRELGSASSYSEAIRICRTRAQWLEREACNGATRYCPPKKRLAMNTSGVTGSNPPSRLTKMPGSPAGSSRSPDRACGRRVCACHNESGPGCTTTRARKWASCRTIIPSVHAATKALTSPPARAAADLADPGLFTRA